MSTTDLERVDPINSLAEKSVYETMDAQQLGMLKASRMRKLNDVEIGMALELCRTMGLNPWNDEIYATKGNDGELLIMVGRNGLLRKAEEFADYRGYDAGVLYENDVFEKGDPDPDGKTLRARAGVTHRQAHPKERGQCVGAWAVAERVGRPPRYFFAPLEDYRPSNPHPKSSWSRFPTVMIEKVPISVVHRTLCNLSGVYLREEVDRMLEREDGQRVVITAEEEWEEITAIVTASEADEETQGRLLEGMREMNELSPASWNLAKVQMTIPGRGPEELVAQANQIERDLEWERSRRPRTDHRGSAEEITEADVVEAGGPTAGRAALEEELALLEDSLDGMEGAEATAAKARVGQILDELQAMDVEE